MTAAISCPTAASPWGSRSIAIIAALIDNASWFGFAMWGALVVCAILAATTSAAEGTLVFMIALALAAIMASSGQSLAVVGILIPTLIHVSLFTLVFMTLGAIKARSRVQGALVIVYLVAIAAILLAPPTADIRIASFAKAAQEYFGNVGPALSRLFGIPGLKLDTRLTSLLAFVYSYHYLNWFIKADVIRWADIPRSRLLMVIAASAASTALYFYDYAFGFTFLLALSLVHILLEFPLDSMVLRQLGTAVSGGVRGATRRSCHYSGAALSACELDSFEANEAATITTAMNAITMVQIALISGFTPSRTSE